MVFEPGAHHMNGGALPFVLMFAAVGLALTTVTWTVAWQSLASLSGSALLFTLVFDTGNSPEIIFAGFWLSMIGTAAAVWFRSGVQQPLAIGAAINNGAWSGALAAASDLRLLMMIALPVSLLFVAGRWFKQQGYGIALKVLSSWLVAVGALAMFVSLVPTPGYEADHME
jgi:hypothetical protein